VPDGNRGNSEGKQRWQQEQQRENVWLQADKKTKACFNFLCGNHTRNLPVVRFNKVTTPPLTFTLTQTLALTLHSTTNFRRRRTTSGFMQRLESKRGQLNRRPVNRSNPHADPKPHPSTIPDPNYLVHIRWHSAVGL